MRRWLTILGMLFWAALLCISLPRFTLLGFTPDFESGAQVIAALAMILITWWAGRQARDPRLRPGIAVGGTILALFFGVLWFGAASGGV